MYPPHWKRVYPNHKDVERVKPAGGDLSMTSISVNGEKVIILHTKTAEMLLKDADKAIGKFVNANGVVYQVVGLLPTREVSNPTPSSHSPPYNSYIIKVTSWTIWYLWHKDSIQKKKWNLEKEYRKAIGVHHRFTADDKGAIWMWNRFTQFLQQEKGMRILTIAIWVIGIFTLLSGIVGVK